MRKCCSLELDLHLSPSSTLTDDCKTQFANKQERISQAQRICVFDITELQARAIIWKANQELVKEKVKRNLSYELYSPPTGSLKRSLQRFLQKRSKRLQSTSPYPKN
ncbi:jasmonate-zim-domain protein 7 [Euphorbia peplus]|nr:jasmonate-zim-domain protein 7 [Euphorbia peplus]